MRTDMKLIIAFRNFANAPQSGTRHIRRQLLSTSHLHYAKSDVLRALLTKIQIVTDMTPYRLVIMYRTAASVFRIYKSKPLFMDCHILKRETASCSETSKNIYQSTWHKIPEDFSLYPALSDVECTTFQTHNYN
jgi:hypothetical protein